MTGPSISIRPAAAGFFTHSFPAAAGPSPDGAGAVAVCFDPRGAE